MADSVIKRFSDPIRSGHWWKYKAAHLLAFAYLFFYQLGLPVREAAILLILSALTIIGIAGLGYVINDLYDIDIDRKAGKKNRMADKSILQRSLIILCLLVAAFVPWMYLRSNWVIWILIAIEFILFFLYSHPATRLKERNIWGPFCDALYGHAVPVVIACLTYWEYGDDIFPAAAFFISLFTWQLLKGFRNIFIHQLEDHDNDIRSGIKTYIMSLGKEKAYRLTTRYLLPAEIVSFIAFAAVTYSSFPALLISLPGILLIFVLGHGMFRSTHTSLENMEKNTYLYFLNDVYEIYFPWIVLVFLIISDEAFIIMGIAHILLFPGSLIKILKDLFATISEFFVQLKVLAHFIITGLLKHNVRNSR